MRKDIYLPGLYKPAEFLIKTLTPENFNILVIGSNTAAIASELKHGNASVEIIVEDYDSLMNTKLELKNEPGINVRINEFFQTDFKDEHFDLVFAQASIHTNKRNKIIKEIQRILKPAGYFCTSEIVSVKENIPVFVKNTWTDSELLPLPSKKISEYYMQKKFSLLNEIDFTETLKIFYEEAQKRLISIKKSSDPNKKLMNRISHEINVYLKLGGDKFIGFKTLLLKKNF